MSRNVLHLLRSLFLALFATAGALPLMAATVYVTSTADGGAGSLRAVIAAASPGDTILFDVAVPATVHLSSQIVINKNLTIKGLGANVVTLDGGNGGVTPYPVSGCRIFDIQSGPVTIKALKFANAYVSGLGQSGGPTGDNGGAIRITGTSNVTLEACTFSYDWADPNSGDVPVGGAIYNDLGTLTVNNSTFTGNQAGAGSAIYNHAGTVNLTDCTLDGNTAEFGGALCHEPIGKTSALVHCTVSNNISTDPSASGGLSILDGTISLQDTIVTGSSSGSDGINTFVDLDGSWAVLGYAGTFVSNGYNLVSNRGTLGSILSNNHDQIGTPGSVVAANLGALDASLGTTPVRPLLSGPAVDLAANSSVSLDQRWSPRTGSADAGAFEYNGSPQTFTISGNVSNTPGIVLSYFDLSAKTVTTDGGGNYLISVPSHWSGRITPTTTGYTYPTAYLLEYEVTGNLTGQNLTATPITYAISGSAGAAGATLSYTDGSAKTATADGSGNYTFQVSYHWSGTVTPSMAGYAFSPSNRTYNTVAADQTLQNYTATAILATVSGNAGVAGAILSYTDGGAKSTTADGSGNYNFAVPFNWSGTVVPSKSGYIFSPATRSYSNLITNASSQGYVTTPLAITAESTVPAGTSNHVAAMPNQVGASYAWSVSSGSITSGQGTAVVHYSAGSVGARTLSCDITDAAGILQTISKSVTVVTYNATITTAIPVYAGSTGLAAAVPTVDGGSYLWTVLNGTLTSGQGSPRITYTAGAAGTAILLCEVTNNLVVTYGSKNVTVTASPAEISTVQAVQAGSRSNQAFVAAHPGASYTWSISNGSLLSGQGTSTVVYAAGGAGSLQLDCTATIASVPYSASKTVTVNAYSAGISAPTAAFAGQTGLVAAVPDLSGASFVWSVTNGSITSGQGTRQITFSAGVTGTLSLGCDVTTGGTVHGSRTVAVLANATSISAETSIVDGTGPHLAYVPMQSGAAYTWTLSNGTVTSGQGGYAITYNTSGPGNLGLTCSVTDPSGNTLSASKTVAVTLYTAPIAAETLVVNGTAGLTATVLPVLGGSYVWTVSNGTLTGGQGTPSITYTAGSQGTATLLCAVTVGSKLTYGTQKVIVQSAATDIWCATTVQAGGMGYLASVAKTPGATYTWAISNGSITGGQGTNKVTFTAGSVGSLELDCTVTTGTSALGSKSLSVIPYGATITDTRILYAGQTGNPAQVVPLAGATYLWSISNGTITSGQGTAQIRYTAGVAGSLDLHCDVTLGSTVTGSSTLTVKASASSITAITAVLAGTTGHGASVPRLPVGTYVWSLGNGTITAGQGTNYIYYTAGTAGNLDLHCTVTEPDGTSTSGNGSVAVH